MSTVVTMHVRAGAEVDTVVAAVLDTLVRVSGARRASLALTEGGGRRLRVTTSDDDLEVGPDGDVGLRWGHVDSYDHQPLTSVVRTGKPVMGVLDLMAAQYPEFTGSLRREIVAVAVVPLRARTDILGAIELLYDVPQPFGSKQIAQLEFTAARAASELREAGRPSGPVLPIKPGGPGRMGAAEAGEPEDSDHREVAEIEMEATPVAVARVRRFARLQLQGWGVDEDTLDTVVLCISELVTNVVMHAGSKAWVSLTWDRERVGVTVRDAGGPALFAVSSDVEALPVHGRGLQLVESLSDEWGSVAANGGTTVWCVFWHAAASA